MIDRPMKQGLLVSAALPVMPKVWTKPKISSRPFSGTTAVVPVPITPR